MPTPQPKPKIFSLATVLGLGFLLSCGGGNNGHEPQPIPIQQAPLNPEFEEWQLKGGGQQGIPGASDKLSGYIPSPFLHPATNGAAPQAATQIEALVKAGAAAYPASYSLVDLGQVSAIRNQGQYGTCWAFAALASVESSIKKSIGATMDLSEWHLAYYTYNPINGLPSFSGALGSYAFDRGGNSDMALAIMSRGPTAGGPVAETSAPYGYGTPSASAASVANLKNAYMLGNMYSDRDAVKGLVQTYGAIYVSMYMDESSTYYRPTTAAYRRTRDNSHNHAVNIVGWNDNYPKTNFPSGNQPASDGAWIIRNSWGTSWHDRGYFYMSYDTPVSNFSLFESNTEVDKKVYQYDMLGRTSSTGYGSNTAWFSNIYTAAGSERVTDVAFYTSTKNASYEITIKTGVDATPASGAAAGSPTTGAAELPGYHRVKLNAPVNVSGGQKFAVIVKLTETGTSYPVGISYALSGYSSATAMRGVGFMSPNGATQWDDVTSRNSTASVCLKAFTELGSSVNIPVTGVALNKTSMSLAVGDQEQLTSTIQPSNATNKTVSWSSSNNAIASVSASGLVTGVGAGTATITVTTQDGSKTASCTATMTIVPVTGVSLNKTAMTLGIGWQEQLTPTIQPSNATNRNVTWSSSNSGIASISAGGQIKGIAVGTTTITVTTQDGGKTARCTVTVVSQVVWAAVSAGDEHTAALKTDGSLWAWGNNKYGQLGIGTYDDRPHSTPVQVGTAKDWAAVSVGGSGFGRGHTLAIKKDGSLWAWGHNEYGLLGIGTRDSGSHPTPVQVGTSKDWAAVSTGAGHTLAIKSDGSLWAWGGNGGGQLGLGDFGYGTDRYTPVQVGTAKDWAAVTGGDEHTLALKKDGTLWVWGYNGYGQLGLGDHGGLYNGHGTDRYTPVQVGTAKDWAAVTGGDKHTLALKKDGSLWAWGDNWYGQLGVGTYLTHTQHPTPVQVGAAKDWAAVSAGYQRTVALKTDGSLWNWGGTGNDYGSRNVPILFGSAKDWVVLSAGDGHTLAIKADGNLWAWGNNSSGQLGNGNSSWDYSLGQVVTPVAVTGVSLNKTATTLGIGGKEQLTPTIQPSDATNQDVTWSSSNNAIASVSASGLVTGAGIGTAVITVTTQDGSKTATCAVTVTFDTPVGQTIYVAGSSNVRATLWKNGVRQQLSGNNNSGASSVYVSGNDVYVAGHEYVSSKRTDVAVLWKNGTPQQLSTSNNMDSYASSVYVYGSDVYVVGYESDLSTDPYQKSTGAFAALWKNGVRQRLGNNNRSAASYVFVSGNDVYVAGYEGDSTTSLAVLWKNGVRQQLSAGNNVRSYANSVYVSGSNVYVVGREAGENPAGPGQNPVAWMRAVLWKNGVRQQLSANNWSSASSVFVSGSDLYVAGEEGYRAVLWKNGVSQQLSTSMGSYGNSVFVCGPDVYVAGYESSCAVLWRNGVRQQLSADESSTANSVFVK